MTADPTSFGTQLLYRSSNGDEWHFVRDERSGREHVLHTANPASGGTVTEIEPQAFLALGNGPEQQGLKRLLAARG